MIVSFNETIFLIFRYIVRYEFIAILKRICSVNVRAIFIELNTTIDEMQAYSMLPKVGLQICLLSKTKKIPRCKLYRKIPWIMNIKARGSYGCLIQPLGHT